MLVLSRMRDESIMIGDKVVITIVDIRGDKVRLGIEAPDEIPVHRQEVYEAIKREGGTRIAGKSAKHGKNSPQDLPPPPPQEPSEPEEPERPETDKKSAA